MVDLVNASINHQLSHQRTHFPFVLEHSYNETLVLVKICTYEHIYIYVIYEYMYVITHNDK